MTEPAPVIAIDGPSGVGKGTLARWLATQLGWHLLDSGMLYRLTALAAQRQSVALDDAHRLASLAAALNVDFTGDAEATQIHLAGDDVSTEARSETVGNAASQVAALAPVRQALLQRQREFRRSPGLVADGRDMGTVVFPNAAIKLFLTASAEERARRRHKQLMTKKNGASLASLAQAIAERDQRDAMRAVAPLRPAADAVILDTTGLTIARVRARALAIVTERL